ncbi:two-component sensor histidine kinase, partial [Malaciobacter mytili]
MNNISIKKKLLIYNIFIQIVILFLFSISLYKTLEISSKDKVEATLKVILLDVVDDVIEHKNELTNRVFDEEKEYKFEPLYIRLLELQNDFLVIKSTTFPNEIKSKIAKLKLLKSNNIVFEYQKDYIISRIKFDINNKDYV